MQKALKLVEIGAENWNGSNGTDEEDPCEPYGGGVMVYFAGVAVVYHMVATLGIQVVRRIWESPRRPEGEDLGRPR